MGDREPAWRVQGASPKHGSSFRGGRGGGHSDRGGGHSDRGGGGHSGGGGYFPQRPPPVRSPPVSSPVGAAPSPLPSTPAAPLEENAAVLAIYKEALAAYKADPAVLTG